MPKAAIATSNHPLPIEAQAAAHPAPDSNSLPGTGVNLLPSTGTNLLASRGTDRPRGTPIRPLSGTGIRRLYSKGINRLRHRAQRGAVTAEYAIMIVGACAFGGVLVALLRSPAMQNALKAIINYGLKIAGVEGVHI